MSTDFHVGSNGMIEGYGAYFSNLDSHRDVIEPGAMSESLARSKSAGPGRTPKMLLMHGLGTDNSAELPIGVWDDLHEDSKGLYVKGRLAIGNSRADDVHTLLKMNPPILNGLSVGFRALKFTMHPEGRMPDGRRRTLHKIHLGEVSIVTDPSNDLARIHSVKSADPVLAALKRLAESLS